MNMFFKKFYIIRLFLLFLSFQQLKTISANNNTSNYICKFSISLIRNVVAILINWNYSLGENSLDPCERIKNFMYPVSQYDITTEDGYIIKLYRIPFGRNSKASDNRPPVLLNPGLLCTANCFVDLTPERSLGYLLAEQGYDVWLLNYRGTTHSRQHIKYDPMVDEQFWSYSIEEIGIYDLSASIDFILKVTNRDNLSLIGHSQGTTTAFILTSLRPEYNLKINVLLAMAPVAFLQHVPHCLHTLAFSRKFIFTALKIAGIYDILPHNDNATQIVSELCTDDAENDVCIAIINTLVGYNPDMFDLSDISIIAQHFPGGCATKQLNHFMQWMASGKFARYNYGRFKNVKIYGQKKPPDYNLNNITLPVYLMYGDFDNLATPQDVVKLHNLLPNSELYRINYTQFNHADFIWGKHVIEVLYNYMFDVLKQFNK